jgi:bifunctional non-homologous end joining protein LigD
MRLCCVCAPSRPGSSRRVSRPKPNKLPSGSNWLHEIKHDGFRIIARKKGAQVRLYSRPGNDLTRRFPLIVETLARLRSRSCIIDGDWF